jgi:hypothetical protein
MKLKRSSKEAAPVADETKPASGGAFISARLRNPAEEVAAQAKSSSDTVGGVCAIIATVMMIAVAALLYMNWDAIKSA